MVERNDIYRGDCRELLQQLEDNSIDCCITSPPYFSLREYQIEPIVWDGDSTCQHEWGVETIKNLKPTTGANSQCTRPWREEIPDKLSKGKFCSKCGAWLGNLGSEPDFKLYISHLCSIFNLLKPKLKETGTLWVNLGDTYNGSGGAGGDYNKNGLKEGQPRYKQTINRTIPKKSLLLIPERFAIEMVDSGWILRNIIIWQKDNVLPNSAKDRFTVDFEYIFFFTKSNETQYWTNKRIFKLTTTKPLGIKGIENEDWEWIECPKCNGLGTIEKELCKRCKGSGKVQRSLWSGHDYFFDQNAVKERASTEFIYSRNSNKGGVQETNNPKVRWGLTMQELRSIAYDSKYKRSDYGQTLQGFIRTNSIKQERDLSRKEAKDLFPNDPKKQQQYINYVHDHGHTKGFGRNKRCVWSINTQQNLEFHFATFPASLVRPMILSGSPKYLCKQCGKPREKIGKYIDCGCNAGWDAGVVLDLFAGIGTTLLEAFNQGRDYIGFEISPAYVEMAKRKLKTTKYKRLDAFFNGTAYN